LAPCIAFIGSGTIYFLAKVDHRRKEDADISMNFREIPPE
jgi:hypothetical protein